MPALRLHLVGLALSATLLASQCYGQCQEDEFSCDSSGECLPGVLACDGGFCNNGAITSSMDASLSRLNVSTLCVARWIAHIHTDPGSQPWTGEEDCGDGEDEYDEACFSETTAAAATTSTGSPVTSTPSAVPSAAPSGGPATIEPTTEAPTSDGCAASEIECQDGECIPASLACDGECPVHCWLWKTCS